MDIRELLAEQLYEYRHWLLSVFSGMIPDIKKSHTPFDAVIRSKYIDDLNIAFDRNELSWKDLPDGQKDNYRHWVDVFIEKINTQARNELEEKLRAFVGVQLTPDTKNSMEKVIRVHLGECFDQANRFVPQPDSMLRWQSSNSASS